MAGEAVTACGAFGGADDLSLLLGHEREATSQPLLEALLELRLEGPPPARAAADRLVRDYAPWALDLAKAARVLIEAAGDERAQRLFGEWSLRTNGRSQIDLAAQEGLSAARVGRIVQRAEARIRDALQEAPVSLRWAVRTVRSRAGLAAPEAHLDVLTASLCVGTGPAVDLVRWLAGPYQPVPGRPGWLAVDPKPLLARTSECLAADGGVRRLEDVALELSELGMHADHLVGWLGASGAIVIHDCVVSLRGPLADAVERVLDAHGAARSPTELAVDLAAGGVAADELRLTKALRSRRFTRTAKGALRLAAWGDEAPRAAKKGRAPRPARTPPAPTDRHRSEERLWLWVRVDADVLRGAEAPVPAVLVEGLGVVPLTRHTFSSRFGPVTLCNDGPQPTRGSVRAVALAAGACLDDSLLLGFSACGDVAVEVRRNTGTVAESGEPEHTVTGGTR